MARTNQAIFKKIIKEFTNLQELYNDTINDYFNSDEWIGESGNLYSSFLPSADTIYNYANTLIENIQGMLNATKFEKTASDEKYQEMLNQCRFIKNDIVNRLKTAVECSGYPTETESETLKKYNVGRVAI